jgi:glucosamine kinase
LARLIGIGIDAGGSATRWSAWGTNGPVAAGEVIPVTGHLFNASERERFAAMAEALGEALKPVLESGAAVGAVVAGITGMSATAPEAALAAGMLADATGATTADVHVEDDIWIAYHAAFAPGAGHVVYCGTGSIGVHIATDGTVVRAGGRGMLIDDGGSAFWIGRAALNLIWRARDGDDEASGPLADAVAAMIGGRSWDQGRTYVYGGGRSAVAALALAVARAAVAGDAEANLILRDAGRELARLAAVLARRKGMKPVALLGRAGGLHPVILATMQEALPTLEVTRRELDAAETAARLAFEGVASKGSADHARIDR